MAKANVRARAIAAEVARSPLATASASPLTSPRFTGSSAQIGAAPEGVPERVANQETGSPRKRLAQVTPRRITIELAPDEATGEPAPQVSSSEVLNLGQRHLLFVWDSSIVTDEAAAADLLAFAVQRGFDTLAVEATGVGYHDVDLTAAFARFTGDAQDLGIETFALVGYPWFTVSPSAGLPGQPTSSLEGLDVLETIVQTGYFDGIVDDSHPYGVEYEVDGETRNWLFDEPAAAGLDLQAWLRAAKAVAGDLPLVKTTPFWFDSHPGLQDIVDLDGQGYQTLAHLIVNEVDATAVLAYRDEMGGPNGILELVAGELTMGPALLVLETSDLGNDLDYLTFHEEGLRALESMIDSVGSKLGSYWGFAGTGVHHYGPIAGMTQDLLVAESFGFVGSDKVTIDYGVLVDAYDSTLGRYYDQMSYQEAVGTVAGVGEGAAISNGDVEVGAGARVFGDVRAGHDASIDQGYNAIVTGEAVLLASPVELPEVDEIELTDDEAVKIKRNREGSLTGSGHYDKIELDSYASLTIYGPAEIVVDDLRLGSYAYIYADPTNGPVKITVNRSLKLSNYAWIAPTSLQSPDLSIDYASSKSLQMSVGSRLLADVLAPRAKISLRNAAEIYGRARAKSLDLQRGSELHLDLALKPAE